MHNLFFVSKSFEPNIYKPYLLRNQTLQKKGENKYEIQSTDYKRTL